MVDKKENLYTTILFFLEGGYDSIDLKMESVNEKHVNELADECKIVLGKKYEDESGNMRVKVRLPDPVDIVKWRNRNV